MFLTNAAICECGLFPIYSQQLPNNAPPPEQPLPLEFQQLCLACIHDVYSKFLEDSYADRWIAAEILNPFFTDSMCTTSFTCYTNYYQQKDFESVGIYGQTYLSQRRENVLEPEEGICWRRAV